LVLNKNPDFSKYPKETTWMMRVTIIIIILIIETCNWHSKKKAQVKKECYIDGDP